MSPRYRSVAVIGTGPSGISAVRALNDEKVFDTIRVFERRDQAGGLWHYDPVPDPFPGSTTSSTTKKSIPANLPRFTPPAPEDLSARTAIYDILDSNVGADVMSFTHTPFPSRNSALSIERFGKANPTRPFRVVAGYLQDLLQDYLHLVSFNTTVERVEKEDDRYDNGDGDNGKWKLTLRHSGQLRHGQPQDYWWEEKFDAVIVASGHYNVPLIPKISGLEEIARSHPGVLEHSKAFRSSDNYVDKRVVVVGGSVSAADLVGDLHSIVRDPLYLSQRGKNEALDAAWNLPNVIKKPVLKRIEPDFPDLDPNTKTKTIPTIKATFTDNTTLPKIHKIIFATGYKLSYPFLKPNQVTFTNRLSGFYQHIFKIGDPSLAIVGQVRGALSFRVYEYQAVAVARYYAGREARPLPTPAEQELWEVERLRYKGPSALFHEIKPDFADYFGFLREFAGAPAVAVSGKGGGDGDGVRTGDGVKEVYGYELPAWDDKWAEVGFGILQLKNQYWNGVGESDERQRQKERQEVRAKL